MVKISLIFCNINIKLCMSNQRMSFFPMVQKAINDALKLMGFTTLGFPIHVHSLKNELICRSLHKKLRKVPPTRPPELEINTWFHWDKNIEAVLFIYNNYIALNCCF